MIGRAMSAAMPRLLLPAWSIDHEFPGSAVRRRERLRFRSSRRIRRWQSGLPSGGRTLPIFDSLLPPAGLPKGSAGAVGVLGSAKTSPIAGLESIPALGTVERTGDHCR